MHVIRSTVTVGLLLAALVAVPQPATAQYKLDSPSGDELVFEREQVRAMLDTTRALFQWLEQDPAVLYATGVGTSVPEDNPTDAYPWNAIEVRNDSIAVILTPNNLREADRAYHNYAVLRMAEVRFGDPDAPCDDLMEAEVDVVSGFVDGWIVARMLFGGAAFEPLDRLAFIRAAGHLAAFVALNEDPSLGVCADEWAEEHTAGVAAFRAWHDEMYSGESVAADESEADEPEAGEPREAETPGGVGAEEPADEVTGEDATGGAPN